MFLLDFNTSTNDQIIGTVTPQVTGDSDEVVTVELDGLQFNNSLYYINSGDNTLRLRTAMTTAEDHNVVLVALVDGVRQVSNLYRISWADGVSNAINDSQVATGFSDQNQDGDALYVPVNQSGITYAIELHTDHEGLEGLIDIDASGAVYIVDAAALDTYGAANGEACFTVVSIYECHEESKEICIDHSQTGDPGYPPARIPPVTLLTACDEQLPNLYTTDTITGTAVSKDGECYSVSSVYGSFSTITIDNDYADCDTCSQDNPKLTIEETGQTNGTDPAAPGTVSGGTYSEKIFTAFWEETWPLNSSDHTWTSINTANSEGGEYNNPSGGQGGCVDISYTQQAAYECRLQYNLDADWTHSSTGDVLVTTTDMYFGTAGGVNETKIEFKQVWRRYTSGQDPILRWSEVRYTDNNDVLQLQARGDSYGDTNMTRSVAEDPLFVKVNSDGSIDVTHLDFTFTIAAGGFKVDPTVKVISQINFNSDFGNGMNSVKVQPVQIGKQ